MSDVQVVWECQDRTNPSYKAVVIRTSPYRGMLTVAFNGKVFHTEIVPVRFDAQYGPDTDDMAIWAQRADEVVSMDEARHGK